MAEFDAPRSLLLSPSRGGIDVDWSTLVGSTAAFCTTVSYFPQLHKCWTTGHAGDLSLTMFSVLTVGIALWCGYGFLQGDYVIMSANGISLLLLLGILYFKIRGILSPKRT